MSQDSATDFALLEAWRDGDAEAGNALVGRYYGPVLRFFEVRTRAADDLTQHTLLACVEGRERYRGDGSFRSYLFSIARRVLMRQLADQHNAARLSRFDEPESAHRTSASMLMARRQEQQVLLASLALLPEAVQSIIVLYYWEQLSAREIGEIMGMPTSTVTTQLSRARQALRDQIQTIAGGRAGNALLADLDAWTRSLAPDDALRLVGADVVARIAALPARRR
ncbi:MAG: sigma-70 family RNA polymerase sigma factor [Myxococcota bacterium]